jgi:hypothetical protein
VVEEMKIEIHLPSVYDPSMAGGNPSLILSLVTIDEQSSEGQQRNAFALWSHVCIVGSYGDFGRSIREAV